MASVEMENSQKSAKKNLHKTVEVASGNLHIDTLLKDAHKTISLMSFGSGYHLRPHKATSDVFFNVIEGKCSVRILNENLSLTAGEYTIFPKGQLHEVVAESALKILLIK